MSRIRKQSEYDNKRSEIVSMAITLLDQIGYEEFSVNKVIAYAKMTKGAFFHYFKSKNELIDAIVDIILLPMAEALEEIVKDNTITPKQKIVSMAASVGKIKSTHRQTANQLVRLLQREENKSIADMVVEKSIGTFIPIYESVLKQGNECGDFDIPYPNGSAFIYFNTLAAINKEIGAVMSSEVRNEERYAKLKEKVCAFEEYARSLFGLDDQVNVIDKAMWQIK